MVNVMLMVVPEPAEGTASVLVQGDERPHPFYSSTGDVNHLCGECSFTLAEGVNGAQLHDLVMRCPRCGKYNITRS